MFAYYDYVLAAIPLALFSGALTSVTTSIDLTIAVTISGGFAALLIGHALFVNGPVDKPSPDIVQTSPMGEAGQQAD